jgi:hypothetical protein
MLCNVLGEDRLEYQTEERLLVIIIFRYHLLFQFLTITNNPYSCIYHILLQSGILTLL